MKVILFGTGHYYQQYKGCFSKVEIAGLLDNNIAKQGRLMDGHTVYAPEKVISLSFDQIWLLSFDSADMRRQLLSIGIDEKFIYEVWEIGHALGEHLVVPNGELYLSDGSVRTASLEDVSDKVVLLTPNLMLNGAEIALVQLVRVMLKLGYKPLVSSLRDGPLREELMALNVPVILMGEASHDMSLTQLPYLKGAYAYIFNTIEMYLIMRKRYKHIPTAWWLHDSDMVYQETHIIDGLLSKLDLENVDIRVVSSVAAEAFFSHYGEKLPVTEMPVGLQDWATEYVLKQNRSKEHLFTFAMVGNISVLKAQNIFISAVKKLPEMMRERCRFCIIGSERNRELIAALKEQAESVPSIQFMGEMGRHELLGFYAEKMDVLVCPSCCETLSIVSVEAMMFERPVIASEGVGIASMLIDVHAGLSMPVGDADGLSKAMQWMYENPCELELMGKRARSLFEEKFTMKIFQERVELFMKNLLGR